MIRRVIFGAGVLFAGAVAHAANITWGSVTDYSSTNDVSTAGSLVEAINACGTANLQSPLINGVQFVARTDLMAGDASITFFFNDTGDSEYNALLNTLDYGSDEITVGNGQLEVGKEYQIQVWFLDQRSNQDARAMQFGDGNGNLSEGVNDQFVTGTFIADGASQTITVNGVSGVTPHINAYQVRNLNSPVPTLSSTTGDTVSGAFSVAVSFSEDVTGLEAADFAVVNGTASGVSGSGTNWFVTITPTANGDVSVTLPADRVISGSGHSNTAGNSVLTTYVSAGSEQPVPTLSTAVADVYGDYTVQINFNEAVTGLELSDFVVTNGTASSLAGSGNSYTVVITPDFGGDVTVILPRNSVADLDGDGLLNVASSELVTAFYQSVMVSSLAELRTYLPQNNINCVLAPGSYTITAADVSSGLYPDYTLIDGRNYKALLLFSGNNSTYDFTGVTLNVHTAVWMQDYGNNGVYEVQVTGNNNVLKNLTMIDVGTVEDDPRDGCVNIVMDGSYNRIEGFHITSMGSYPYGYGDCFGKGGGPVISHNKHSTFLIRGESNHARNCTLIHRTYGHAMFMQAASNPIIEGCYIKGEMRSTDDMLLEEGTESPADNVNFLTVWGDDDDEDRYGYRLPSGFMKSTGEGGIRAYNAGETIIDGVVYTRGTSNPTIINNTVINMRTGVTLTHASGTKYVAGCTTIGCERGYAIGSGIIENCFADVQYGPAFGVDYESDRGITADITILPYTGKHYNGSRHFAYIYGSNHNLTFRGLEEHPDQELVINVGGDKTIESNLYTNENYSADNIIINNLTGYPVVLDDNASDNTIRSMGSVIDEGTDNSIVMEEWSMTSNLTFYGEATQSSAYYDSGSKLRAIASLAIDQNTDGNFSNGSVTHTNYETQPWWRLDLKKPFEISEIRIWGRTLSSQSRLSNYDVTILDSDYQPVWTSYQSGYPNPMISLPTGSAVGQYVLIQLRGSERLSLAEVQVFGTRIDDSPEISVFTSGTTFAPIISTNDLAQTQYESSSATGGNEAAQHAELFNGTVGNEDGDSDDPGEVRLSSDNAVTVSFDTSIHTNGYDLTGINTCFGWNTASGGRANQGYEIILTYVDGATKTWAGPEHWDPNSPTAFYWTKVSFTEASGRVMASGVKAVTFNITEDANPGSYVVAREIDIFGMPSRSAPHYLPEFLYGGSTVSNGNFITQFAGEPGEAYTVEWAPGLTNEWEAVTNIVSLETSPLTLSIPATNSAGFFRVRWGS
ncbi:Ig-like domain-containing protein [Pontiellaceae bacterium B12219]|nr:Ig-like domain-containing protein [Pontiellaceae bacterium B12219]